MNIKRSALPILLSAITGCAGYYLGAIREQEVSLLPTHGTVALDYLVSLDSFSEVENARAVLDALAVRYVEQAQGLIAQEVMSQAGGRGTRRPSPERPVLAAVKVLEKGITEFKGTDQELRFLPTLLYALKREKLYDRWIQVYLSTLYQHPTDERVGDLVADALSIGQAIGREQEVRHAIRHLSGIPPDFRAQSRIEAALASTWTELRTADDSHDRAL